MMTSEPPADRSLIELELLRAYKVHFGRRADANLSPFAEDRVVRYDAAVGGYDVPDIHREVRGEIEAILRGLHCGHPSQVVILAGSPGMGKSHIINQFRDPARASELGYVLVCNSNHWKADEFDGCLLDWVLAALVAPSPEESHLLLEKVRDIAFRALSMIVAQPGQLNQFKAKSASGVLARIWAKLRGDDYARFHSAIDRRDPEVFRQLDYAAFAKYVCARFLKESGHPFHRYVVHVLLRYLFPEDREYVLHWLRRRPVGDFFLRKLGVRDEIDRQYKLFDAIKILVSLFTDEVAERLADGPPVAGSGRAFFFAFDQVEGRNELFDSDTDWFKFFAQLSELYNALPNVFVLFTMTIGLRDKLYGRMEQQFRDRIRRDDKFLLTDIKETEVLALYQQRVAHWLASGPPGLWERVMAAGNPYLPFDEARVAAMAATRTLRDMLDEFDRQFRNDMTNIVIISPQYDFEVRRREYRSEETATQANKYTEDYLELLAKLFAIPDVRTVLPDHFRLRIDEIEWMKTTDGLNALIAKFYDAADARWVRVAFVRFGQHFNPYLDGCKALIAGKWLLHNQLWLFRATAIATSSLQSLPGNAYFRTFAKATHTDLRAMLATLERRSSYKSEVWAKFLAELGPMLANSPLGDLFGEVRLSLDRQKLRGDAAEEGEP